MSTRRRWIVVALAAAVAAVAAILSTRSHEEKHATALPAGIATSVAVASDGTVLLGGQDFAVAGSSVTRVEGPVAAVAPSGLAAATVLEHGRYVPELLRVPSGDVLARGAVGDGDAIARGLAGTPGGGAALVADATHDGRRVIAVTRYDGSGHVLGTRFIEMPGRSLSAAGVAVTRSGEIVVAGTAYDTAGGSDVFVARGGGPPRTLRSGAVGTVARGVTLDANGRAVIAASGRQGGRSAFAAVFESRPAVVVRAAGEAFATGVAVDRRGSIVLAGRVDGRGTLVRLTPAGRVDRTFRPPPLPDGPQLTVAADPNGGVIVAGTRIAAGRARTSLARVR